MGFIFCTEYPMTNISKSVFGNIMKYPLTGRYTYDMYDTDLKKGTIKKGVVKVWSGR